MTGWPWRSKPVTWAWVLVREKNGVTDPVFRSSFKIVFEAPWGTCEVAVPYAAPPHPQGPRWGPGAGEAVPGLGEGAATALRGSATKSPPEKAMKPREPGPPAYTGRRHEKITAGPVAPDGG